MDALYVHKPRAVPRDAALEQLYAQLPEYLRNADGTPDYLRLILSAHLYDLVKLTPLQPAAQLSLRLGCEVLFKREDLQPVFTFKLRGAYNMMRQLDDERKWKGVVACSAGNHAQGVAMAGAHLSIPCMIVMPRGTPRIKWENVERLGAKVIMHGADFDEAKAECHRLAEAHGLTIIPPFDDPRVIAGQGTLAVEVCNQTDMNKVDAIFCAVGGGGLAGGVAAYVKRIAPPHVKVFGVETFDGDAMQQSLERGDRVMLRDVGLFSDGTAVRQVGAECFRLCSTLLDGVVRVSNDEICAAIKDVFSDTRSITEPAGALAIAGLKRYVAMQGAAANGRRYIGVVCGANMDFSRLRFVAERADIGEEREVLLSAELPEEPGSFMRLYQHLAPRDITEFSYRYSDGQKAFVYVAFILNGMLPAAGGNPIAASGRPASDGVSSARDLEVRGVLEALNADGLRAHDISGDELAKAHARYFVGGRENVRDERLFRFQFPERPGALRRFLEGINAGWNISLFHYRNHGGDIGKVLAGIQVPPESAPEFDRFLRELDYIYSEETENPVYQRYMRST